MCWRLWEGEEGLNHLLLLPCCSCPIRLSMLSWQSSGQHLSPFLSSALLGYNSRPALPCAWDIYRKRLCATSLPFQELFPWMFLIQNFVYIRHEHLLYYYKLLYLRRAQYISGFSCTSCNLLSKVYWLQSLLSPALYLMDPMTSARASHSEGIRSILLY